MKESKMVLQTARAVAIGHETYSCIAVRHFGGYGLEMMYRHLMLDGIDNPERVEDAAVEIDMSPRDFRVMLLCMFAAVLEGEGR